MSPISADGAGAALDRVLDQLRIGLLARAADQRAAARNPKRRCRPVGAERPHRAPRGTAA